MEDFYMGNVHDADVDQGIKKMFMDTHVFTKKDAANAGRNIIARAGVRQTHTIPPGISGSHMKLAARRKKKRIETAIAIKVFEEDLL